MARIARVVVPHYPHHVTQRGSRRQQTFYTDDDYRSYIQTLAQFVRKYGVEIWAYCLMPNHVHLVAVPESQQALSMCLSRAHRHYALNINKRNNWKGHLWQERFYSFVMDERHLLSAVKYVELNPVRAKLCKRPNEWPWSSALAHLAKRDDQLVKVKPMLERVTNWDEYLNSMITQADIDAIRKSTKTGRPAGKNDFLNELERLTGRKLQKEKPGPKTRR